MLIGNIFFFQYHTKAAEIYKEKLTAECEGRPYDAPPPSPALAQPNYGGNATAMTAKSVAGVTAGAALGAAAVAPALTDKERNESFFAGKGAENSSRPADLPPSQGGRFQGFGSSCKSELVSVYMRMILNDNAGLIPIPIDEPPETSQGASGDFIGSAFSSLQKGFNIFS